MISLDRTRSVFLDCEGLRTGSLFVLHARMRVFIVTALNPCSTCSCDFMIKRSVVGASRSEWLRMDFSLHWVQFTQLSKKHVAEGGDVGVLTRNEDTDVFLAGMRSAENEEINAGPKYTLRKQADLITMRKHGEYAHSPLTLHTLPQPFNCLMNSGKIHLTIECLSARASVYTCWPMSLGLVAGSCRWVLYGSCRWV